MYVLHEPWANTIYPNVIFRVLEHEGGILDHSLMGTKRHASNLRQ